MPQSLKKIYVTETAVKDWFWDLVSSILFEQDQCIVCSTFVMGKAKPLVWYLISLSQIKEDNKSQTVFFLCVVGYRVS